ncbi:hypothetical protein BC828DRAFT_401154 [Blastocladiella britannica]|nr:hypothetical protein BC828DRAFT_401154 [Blastocladiella britannica]
MAHTLEVVRVGRAVQLAVDSLQIVDQVLALAFAYNPEKACSRPTKREVRDLLAVAPYELVPRVSPCALVHLRQCGPVAAASSGNLDIFLLRDRYRIPFGYTVHYESGTPLAAATYAGHVHVLQYFLDRAKQNAPSATEALMSFVNLRTAVIYVQSASDPHQSGALDWWAALIADWGRIAYEKGTPNFGDTQTITSMSNTLLKYGSVSTLDRWHHAWMEILHVNMLQGYWSLDCLLNRPEPANVLLWWFTTAYTGTDTEQPWIWGDSLQEKFGALLTLPLLEGMPQPTQDGHQWRHSAILSGMSTDGRTDSLNWWCTKFQLSPNALKEMDFSHQSLFDTLAASNQLASLEWWYWLGVFGNDQFEASMYHAASHGHLAILKWGKQMGQNLLPLSTHEDTIRDVFRGNHLAVFEWLVQENQLQAIPDAVITQETRCCHVSMLDALVRAQTVTFSVKLIDLDHACAAGNWDMLHWWAEIRHELPERTKFSFTTVSMDGASVEILEWWKQLDIPDLPYSSNAVVAAANANQTGTLEWWLASGLPIKYNAQSADTLSEAGHVRFLDHWRLHRRFWHGYSAHAIDSACSHKHGVAVLDWWATSGLSLNYSHRALENATTANQLGVLVWFEKSGLTLRITDQMLRKYRLQYEGQTRDISNDCPDFMDLMMHLPFPEVLAWWHTNFFADGPKRDLIARRVSIDRKWLSRLSLSVGASNV